MNDAATSSYIRHWLNRLRVRPRIVGLCCGAPLEEFGDVVVHLAASDGHDSVRTVSAVVDVQP